MQTRSVTLSVLVAVVGAATVAVGAQQSAESPERLRRCFTPVTTTGVYFAVTANGPTERLLRLVADAPRQKVTHSMVHPPAIHSVQLRAHRATPTLLTPQRVVDAAPARTHRHESVYTFSPAGAEATSMDMVIDSAIGPTGCRLRLRHVR